MREITNALGVLPSRATIIPTPRADSPMKMPPVNPEIASDTLDRFNSSLAFFSTCW